MKKIVLGLSAFFLLAPSVMAATIFSDFYTNFSKNETRQIWPIRVEATAENEITSAKGFNLLFDVSYSQMLWDETYSITATGTAVDNGKMSATPKPEYLQGYKILHFPVLANFAPGEFVKLEGVRMRAYKHSFTRMFLQLDVTGDYTSDATDINPISVTDETVLDRTPPYMPKVFEATLSADLKSVSLTWDQPPDFDLIGMNLDRKRVRAGNVQETNLVSRTSVLQFTDTDILPGDVVTYTISGDDGSNLGGTLVKTIEVKAPGTPTVPETPSVEPTTPPVQTSEAELKQLQDLYGYYKVRYAIKCRMGESVSNSACLWAKVDLVYTQTLLYLSDINTFLSAREIEVMGIRIVWPEQRYQEKCVDAPVPDKSCAALGKAIRWAHFFIDRK